MYAIHTNAEFHIKFFHKFHLPSDLTNYTPAFWTKSLPCSLLKFHRSDLFFFFFFPIMFQFRINNPHNMFCRHTKHFINVSNLNFMCRECNVLQKYKFDDLLGCMINVAMLHVAINTSISIILHIKFSYLLKYYWGNVIVFYNFHYISTILW